MPEEEIVCVIEPNTSAVFMDLVIGTLRIQQVGATTQTLVPPSKAIVPPRIADNITIPHVNLSKYGYKPVSLRSSGMRSSPTTLHETSIIQQLYGPRSLPTVNPTQERMGRFPDQMGQDPSQGSTYVWKTAVSKRREYPKEGAMVINIDNHIKAKGPLTKNEHTKCLPQEDQLGGFPANTLIEEDPLEEDIITLDHCIGKYF